MTKRPEGGEQARFLCEKVCGDGPADDPGLDVPAQRIQIRVLGVLHGNDHRRYRYGGSAAVGYRHLCLAVHAGAGERFLVQQPADAMRQHHGQRQVFRRFVRGIACHDALIARARLRARHRLRDVGGLCVDADGHVELAVVA